MKLSSYLKDKFVHIVVTLSFFILTLLFFRITKTNIAAIIIYTILFLTLVITLLTYDYLRKNKFYKTLYNNIKKLDKAYLITATLEEPNFYDGKLLYELLYDINKSMIENINTLESQTNDFKEYIELWIHEVKIPLASLSLIIHNHQDKFDKNIIEQVKKIDNYVEQILYYSRSENCEKDYLIKKVELNKIINNVLLANKDDILNSNIKLDVDKISYTINTDTKWLEFMINQIISNSIKYKRNIKNSYIKIYAKESKKKVFLYIEDNGIGILESDIKKVFNKSFTGSNGRDKYKSTGMGLYIVKELCNKLGHSISIESEKDKYTRVCITFNNDTIYDVLS